jgi:hypothetical protein
MAPPKKVRGFLGLPGEVRNQIYGYYFQDPFRAEIASKDQLFKRRPPPTFKLCLPIADKNGVIFKDKPRAVEPTPQTVCTPHALGRYIRVHGMSTKWDTSLCPLILVCKQIYNETLVLLYHNTTFVFVSAQRIQNFVKVLPKPNLELVTKLQVHYLCYGDPRMTTHKRFKDKHHDSYLSAFKAASKALVNLQGLEIWIQTRHKRVYLYLARPDLEPVLQFRRLNCGKRRSFGTPAESTTPSSSPSRQPVGPLQRVKVHFSTPMRRKWAHNPSQDILYPPRILRLQTVTLRLHDLFGNAIARAILGWSREDAMAELKAYWDEQEEDWETLEDCFCMFYGEPTSTFHGWLVEDTATGAVYFVD